MRIACLALALSLAACTQGGELATGETDTGPVETVPMTVTVLSNRADLVSGGDVLVSVARPAGNTSPVIFRRGETFATPVASTGGAAGGVYLARLSGLPVGQHTIRAIAGNAVGDVTLVNHPNGGPIFSGPQLSHWKCNNGSAHPQCDKPAEYSFLYKSTDPTATGLLAYDPANPPDDVATTTTQSGDELPFIVRQETGYQDRDQYKILTLYQPGKAWTPWAPQSQWNHKLLITHGGSCGTDRNTGGAPLEDYSGTIPGNPAVEQSYITALGLGFAVGSTALDNLGHNCNVVTAAESLVMMKERLIEQYGTLRYTIGTGCSGGSITQAMVSNAYPGVYQGNITACAYPDVGSTGAQFADLHLLRGYFEDPSKWAFPTVIWNPEQMALVEGHVSHLNAITTDELFFKSVTNPVGDCAGADSYHPTSKPAGVRCGLMDYLVNLTGLRPETVWSPMEQAAKLADPAFQGFAGNPIDNVGIQYGYTVLQQGLITLDQFLDLNEKIGGFDIDFVAQSARSQADSPALANAYRSSEINATNNLDRVAIINAFGADPGAAHDTVHAFWVRRRLDREHGNHDNHVMWGGPTPLVGDLNYMNQALVAMDRWLAEVEKDTSAKPLPQKLTDARPDDIHDQCSDGLGNAAPAGGEECVALLEESIAFSSPREVAGGPAADDVLKCTLRAPLRTDYGLLMSDAQWECLNAIFPTGVCDYTKPGVDQQGGIAWLQYGTATEVITGGQPLPAAPAGSGAGWASPAFGIFR